MYVFVSKRFFFSYETSNHTHTFSCPTKTCFFRSDYELFRTSNHTHTQALGDLYFYLGNFLLPVECADYPEGFDCDNPERESSDLVVTKVDLNVKDFNFTTYSACNLCNGTDPFSHQKCEKGSYICDCMSFDGECVKEQVGRENISSFFVPKPESSKCYQDMETHCGLLKNKGNLCARCTERFLRNQECTWVDTNSFCTTAPCDQDAKDWVCWHNNIPRKTGGFWYSTLQDGMCEHDDDENCTWSVKKTTTVNETCIRSRIESYVEKKDGEDCFSQCAAYPSRNTSDPCWIGCFMDVLMGKDARNNDTESLGGIDIQELVEVWETSFEDGQCPHVTMRNQVDDDASDYSLIPPHKSFELNPFCYDCNNDTYATYVLEHDPLARNHVKVNGSCTSNGFSKFVRNDPLYRDAKLYRK